MQEYSPQAVKTLIEAEVESSLESMLRVGARRLLQTALEMEVASYIDAAQADRDAAGHQAVVRNGYHRERERDLKIGPVRV